MSDHQCSVVTKRQCRNKGHIYLARKGWPKSHWHWECTFHFNRFAFSGGPVETIVPAKEAERE